MKIRPLAAELFRTGRQTSLFGSLRTRLKTAADQKNTRIACCNVALSYVQLATDSIAIRGATLTSSEPV